MRGELTLARCLLPPISPIKNILPSRSARSSPGPQLYFINTFRHVQKGMIHAGPERCETRGRLSAFTGQASCTGPGLALRGYHLSCTRSEDYLDAAGRTYPHGHLSAPPAQPQPPLALGRARCRPSPPPHPTPAGLPGVPPLSLAPSPLLFLCRFRFSFSHQNLNSFLLPIPEPSCKGLVAYFQSACLQSPERQVAGVTE